jgi:hypothetical protein
MRFQILIFCTILTFTCFLTGCPSGEPTTNTNSTVQTNTAANAPKTNSAMETTKATPEATSNEAPTLKPVFKAYCDAMTKKDEAALRKIYSAATLKSLEADMKAENEKSLVKFLEIEQVSNELCEVRNEKIEGDTGVAEVKTKGMPTGAKLKFVKENGEWKLTNEIPDFEAVKKAAENSNTAK